MKFRWLLATALALRALSSHAAGPQQVGPAPAFPLGYQQLTSLGSAAGISAPATATWCIFDAEAQAVRWRDDGTAPTASVGFPLAVGEPFYYKVQSAANFAALEFIGQLSGAILNVDCYQ